MLNDYVIDCGTQLFIILSLVRHKIRYGIRFGNQRLRLTKHQTLYGKRFGYFINRKSNDSKAGSAETRPGAMYLPRGGLIYLADI